MNLPATFPPLRLGTFVPLLLLFVVAGCGTPSKGSSNARLTNPPPPRPRPVPQQVQTPQVTPRPTPPPVVQPLPPILPSATPPIPTQVPQPPQVTAPPASPRPTWIPLQTWAAQNAFAAPVRVSTNAFQIRSTAGTFQFTLGKRRADWNGIHFNLGFAPASTNGIPFIHSLDVEKNLAPLLQVNRPVPRGRGVIVIDPGHGGGDNGTKSALGRGFEKDYTLDWARRLKPLLEARGWKVVLTRPTDRNVELTERVLIAEQNQADLFISLHLNAAANGVTGLETYCLTPAGMASTLTRNFADPTNVVLPGNARDFENMHLAMRVHRSLLQTVGMPDRGVQRARFMAVLKTQQRPAILVEGGYISDRNEARQIDNAEYRQKLALAVAKALE